MPTVQHTPEPYASTILSLAPEEQFRYRGTTISAITVAQEYPYVVFSGTRRAFSSEGTFHTHVPDVAAQAIPLNRPEVSAALSEALQRHAPNMPPAQTSRPAGFSTVKLTPEEQYDHQGLFTVTQITVTPQSLFVSSADQQQAVALHQIPPFLHRHVHEARAALRYLTPVSAARSSKPAAGRPRA